MLNFYQKLDTCAFYGQIVVSLRLDVFNLDNLPVVSCRLLCLGLSYLGVLFILLYLAGHSSHCNLHLCWNCCMVSIFGAS